MIPSNDALLTTLPSQQAAADARPRRHDSTRRTGYPHAWTCNAAGWRRTPVTAIFETMVGPELRDPSRVYERFGPVRFELRETCPAGINCAIPEMLKFSNAALSLHNSPAAWNGAARATARTAMGVAAAHASSMVRICCRVFGQPNLRPCPKFQFVFVSLSPDRA